VNQLQLSNYCAPLSLVIIFIFFSLLVNITLYFLNKIRAKHDATGTGIGNGITKLIRGYHFEIGCLFLLHNSSLKIN
jgi:hypothetical protein